MNRRKAVQKVALLMGGSVLGAEMFIQMGCKTQPKKEAVEAGAEVLPKFFTKEEIAFLDEVAETIIPKTTTPGAKDAKVAAFMDVMVNDCYTPADQKIFKEGIRHIDSKSKETYKNDFMKLPPDQRKKLLTALDKEASEYTQTPEYTKRRDELRKQESKTDSLEEGKGNFGYSKAVPSKHYFSMMKELTLLGFFTSEPGATKAMRYAAVPGKYEKCIPYKKGDKAWATS